MLRRHTWVRRCLLLGLVFMAILSGVVAWRTSQMESRQLIVKSIPELRLDREKLAVRFADAIQIPTVSQSMAKVADGSPLLQFGDFLSSEFPTLHAPPFVCFTGEDFGDPRIPSVLFQWTGSRPELGAVLLMAHFDVVPATDGLSPSPEEGSNWTYPPFSGMQDDTFIWGRGTLDCKQGAMAILEALVLLSEEGFKPERTVLVALGHDEEIGGFDGNAKIARWLESQGRRLHVILDEGGCIFTEFPGLDRPAALVGIAEKGMLGLELQASLQADQVGHASMPPRETAIGILAAAIQRIEENPFPINMNAGTGEMLRYIGPEMPSPFSRAAVANMWLFSPVVQNMLGKKPSGNALLRTTVAPTVLSVESKADNVLPLTANATLNIRLLPGDSVEYATAFLREVIEDERVLVTTKEIAREASAVSSTDSQAFDLLHQTIRQVYPDVVVAPFVVVGATDTVHYAGMCPNIFRFIPTRMSERDTKRFHGIDERIAIDDYLNIVRFYHQFIRNTSANTN